MELRIDQNLRQNIPALNSLAVRSLASLFDEKASLFSGRVSLTETGLRREKASEKLTAIALLGLKRLEASGATIPLDIVSIQDAVWKDRSWVKSIGDLGLLTWFTATCCPERLDDLFREYDFGRALRIYSDARAARTTGLAWFLTGIAHVRLACPNAAWDWTDVAVETYHLLEENQGEGGIFGQAAIRRFLPQAMFNRFGTFADQIHAIYALTTFARAFRIEEALEAALGCANSLRALQGEMGQWWFLYDKRGSRAVNRYPVLSAHQDGTAPLGLLAVGEATGQTFHESIYLGLSWIAGANELGDDLRDLDRQLIWDSIGSKSKLASYWETACSLANISPVPAVRNLRIRYEARPDHFGWLLYAFGKFGLPRPATAGKAATAR
jgi:hypothetical protein